MPNSFNYQRYLASREWGLLKRQIRERSGGKCERNHAAPVPATQVHHVTYERIGHEDLADLQHVCAECHEFLSGLSDVDPAIGVDTSTWSEQRWRINAALALLAATLPRKRTPLARLRILDAAREWARETTLGDRLITEAESLLQLVQWLDDGQRLA